MHRTTLLAIALLAGCANTKIPEATGGSRADGTVTMSYTVTSLERPQVDWAAAKRGAEDRCRSWGYEAAERFGGWRQECVAGGGLGGCNGWMVHIPYQCIGDL